MNYQQIRVQVVVDGVPDYDIVIAEPVMQLSAYLSPLRRKMCSRPSLVQIRADSSLKTLYLLLVVLSKVSAKLLMTVRKVDGSKYSLSRSDTYLR